jgi:2-hydroxychromene-2-carboxylate isomerase
MRLYYDLASPYAYLAVSRAARVLEEPPELEPVLLGAIFGYRGHGSWAHTDQRAAGEQEIERRARAYGLPPVRWPEGWPLNSLAAMRAATYAKREGVQTEFVHAVYEREFARGEDISGIEALAAIADSVGLKDVEAAVADAAIKQALREATDNAWAAGVQGVPTLQAGGRMLFGDDRLEEARPGCSPRAPGTTL